jgi:hypothetical protein
MENNNLDSNETQISKSVTMNALNYGIIVGFIMIVYSVILYSFNMSENKILAFLSYIFLIIGMYYGSNKFRTLYSDGFLSFGKSFKSNFLIGLFASLVMVLWTFIFFQFIDTEMVTKIIEKAQEGMLESNPNMTEDEMNMGLKYVKMFTNPLMMAVMSLLYNLFFSVILGLIIAIFVKKEESTII